MTAHDAWPRVHVGLQEQGSGYVVMTSTLGSQMIQQMARDDYRVIGGAGRGGVPILPFNAF
jgi:hypothetical protein